jgi:soluble lytic murein transglycosylase-like protein
VVSLAQGEEENLTEYSESLLREYGALSAARYGVPQDIFSNLITAESGWKPNAQGATGDVGIAQLIPRYHPGVDATDPLASLDEAARYLKENYDRFGTWEQSVAAYNMGPTALAANRGQIPAAIQSYVSRIVPQTGGTSGGIGVTSGAPSSASAAVSVSGDSIGRKIGFTIALVMVVFAISGISKKKEAV